MITTLADEDLSDFLQAIKKMVCSIYLKGSGGIN